MLVYIASLAVIALIVGGFLAFLDRRDRRERAERAELLQRIQAPHAAVAEHYHRADPPVETESGLPMTDAEVAEVESGRMPDVDAEREQWIARVEAIENGRAQLLDGVLP